MNGSPQFQTCSPILDGEVFALGFRYDEGLIGSFFVNEHQMIPGHDDLARDGSEGDSEFGFLHLGRSLSDEEACAANPNREAPDNGLLHDDRLLKVFGARSEFSKSALKIVRQHYFGEVIATSGGHVALQYRHTGRSIANRFATVTDGGAIFA